MFKMMTTFERELSDASKETQRIANKMMLNKELLATLKAMHKHFITENTNVWRAEELEEVERIESMSMKAIAKAENRN